MAPMLVAGHVHQALREGGMQIALIWPTRWPDRWHVGLTTTLRWATRDPVPGDRVIDVLQAWGFDIDQYTSLCHWRWADHWCWSGQFIIASPTRIPRPRPPA
jgi:hypothetical protein